MLTIYALIFGNLLCPKNFLATRLHFDQWSSSMILSTWSHDFF